MTHSHDVISAFLDDRPFDLEDLADTLEEPQGRALLIDLLALRRIVQPTDAVPVALPLKLTTRPWLRPAIAAAAVFVALAGGYVVGIRRAPTVLSEAPAPTRIVQVTSTGQDLLQGGR
jgi:hypothetical protein